MEHFCHKVTGAYQVKMKQHNSISNWGKFTQQPTNSNIIKWTTLVHDIIDHFSS